jgi:hypothetical protein
MGAAPTGRYTGPEKPRKRAASKENRPTKGNKIQKVSVDKAVAKADKVPGINDEQIKTAARRESSHMAAPRSTDCMAAKPIPRNKAVESLFDSDNEEEINGIYPCRLACSIHFPCFPVQQR